VISAGNKNLKKGPAFYPHLRVDEADSRGAFASRESISRQCLLNLTIYSPEIWLPGRASISARANSGEAVARNVRNVSRRLEAAKYPSLAGLENAGTDYPPDPLERNRYPPSKSATKYRVAAGERHVETRRLPKWTTEFRETRGKRRGHGGRSGFTGH